MNKLSISWIVQEIRSNSSSNHSIESKCSPSFPKSLSLLIIHVLLSLSHRVSSNNLELYSFKSLSFQSSFQDSFEFPLHSFSSVSLQGKMLCIPFRDTNSDSVAWERHFWFPRDSESSFPGEPFHVFLYSKFRVRMREGISNEIFDVEGSRKRRQRHVIPSNQSVIVEHAHIG
jgi:hypothetical protein